MEINELLRIKALGNLLHYYYSDLEYILNFQLYKQNAIKEEVYLSKSAGFFCRFIKEFGVIRNVKKDMIGKVLKLTMKWIRDNKADDVDGFATNLREEGVTTPEGNQMTSLASKVLFLNNPWLIFPYDSHNRKALRKVLGIKKPENYRNFFYAVGELMQKKTLSIEKDLNLVLNFLDTIEKEFNGKIKDVEIIRQNRYADKLLWAQGD